MDSTQSLNPETGVETVLERFGAISVPELQGVNLQRRFDTKYMCSAAGLKVLLANIADHYAVLSDDGRRIASYQTQYFDTVDLRCFHDHRRGRRSRYKVRIRSYPERQAAYLEVKEKTNRDETRKYRLMRAVDAPLAFTSEESELIKKRTPLNPLELKPQLSSGFRRITLVGQESVERVTVDVDLHFLWQGSRQDLAGLAIVEVKQGCYSRQSPVMRALRSVETRPFSVSKYCTGNTLFSVDRSEGFYRENFRRMEKLRNG